MSFLLWIVFQIVSTGAFVVWYARKHPSDAMQMFVKWRSFFSK